MVAESCHILQVFQPSHLYLHSKCPAAWVPEHPASLHTTSVHTRVWFHPVTLVFASQQVQSATHLIAFPASTNHNQGSGIRILIRRPTNTSPLPTPPAECCHSALGQCKCILLRNVSSNCLPLHRAWPCPVTLRPFFFFSQVRT